MADRFRELRDIRDQEREERLAAEDSLDDLKKQANERAKDAM